MKERYQDREQKEYATKKIQRDRRKKITCFVCLLLFLVLVQIGLFIEELSLAEEKTIRELDPSQLHAMSAVLMDGTSGRILYEKNGYQVMPMASTTKIMTCILALENSDLNDMMTASSYAASMPQVRLGVKAGEQYRMEDLLYSLMLESHNDAAVVVAEGIAGSVEAFADMMNQKARDIGAYDTFFVTPNGLDATAMCEKKNDRAEERAHSTTAADLARILRYCIGESPQSQCFLKITQTRSHSFTDGEGRRTFHCYNHNAFLDMMDGALTGKTGFTGKAGYCYVGAVEQEGERYIVALLACGWPGNKTYKWSDMRKLVNYGLENYSYQNVWKEPPAVRVPVENGVPQSDDPNETIYVSLKADGQDISGGSNTGANMNGDNIMLKLLLREDEQVEIEIDVVDSLQAPVEADTIAGTVTYRLGEETVYSYNLVTADTVEKKDWIWYVEYLWTKLLMD